VEDVVWLVLVLSAVGVTVVALRIFFALKTAHTARKELDANRGAPLSDADSRGRTGIEVAVSPIISSETIRDKSVRKEMWVDSQYCWVVVCKNHWFHRRPNLFHTHRIALGETDAVTPRPKIDRAFFVRCDDCGKEYSYKPSEVLRYEQDLPESFTPHPLFRMEY
jgi:hypothetical protein